jgi:hypothetical protein
MIEVEKLDDSTYKVTVKGRSVTSHEVRVDSSYHQKLTAGSVTPETLIEKSFEFLLERESNTSILRTFDLPVIGRYFPEYEKVIRKIIRG